MLAHGNGYASLVNLRQARQGNLAMMLVDCHAHAARSLLPHGIKLPLDITTFIFRLSIFFKRLAAFFYCRSAPVTVGRKSSRMKRAVSMQFATIFTDFFFSLPASDKKKVTLP